MRTFLALLSIFAILAVSCSNNDPQSYTLSTTPVPEEGGTITPAEGEFDENRDLEVSATASDDWAFQRWEGDVEGTQNPVIITMDSDKDVAAIFAKRDYPLTINIQGEGDVNERVVQQKTTEYPHGTVVELTAEPATGWQFSEWQGALQGDNNPAEITIEGPVEVTAVFSRIEYPLTITIEGEGEVDERVIQTKTTDYPVGTLVELTAEADSAWAFTEWSGDLNSSENPVQITINEPKSVTATFDRTFSYTAITQPTEGGTITPSDSTFVRDTTIEVEAVPNIGWRFVNWEGDFTGTVNPFNLTMNGNKTIVANFERISYLLETSTSGNGTIVVDVLEGEQTDEGYLSMSEAELLAVPDEGWSFSEWQIDLSGDNNPETLIIDGNKSVRAVFSIFDGGSGTQADPYEISTLDQLRAINDNLDSNFIQVADIDASSTSSGEGFVPIGGIGSEFTGGFDGDGFTINGLAISRPSESNIGLFGVVDGAMIQNVNLVNVNVTGGVNVGGLVGENGGEVSNAAVSGFVSGTRNIGGLIGLNSGLSDSTSSSASVSGSENAGGVAGSNSGQLLNSEATGSVSGSLFTGGLVGDNTGAIIQSSASGAVNGGFNAGGLIGQNRENGEVSESYASGTVSGVQNIGGLAGRNFDGQPLIETSYATGSVTGTENIGGLAGLNDDNATINETFATGLISGTSKAGGVIGENLAQMQASYWDTVATGITDGAGSGSQTGAEGLSTDQMTGGAAEVNMSEFDFITTWAIAPAGYPILLWQEEE